VSDFEERLAVLRARFVERLKEDRRCLDRSNLEDRSQEFRHTVHRLAGTAATMGYPAISTKAQTLDHELISGCGDGHDALNELIVAIDEVIILK